jgi:parvulin-like peptidyl-prolyl isomerase
MVRKSRHPGRDEAVGLLGHMGNQVLDGAKLNEVARAGSEGSTACDGGLHDWTNKGSLVSNTLENAIFSLPVGQLSQIIETDTGYHIVRVIQRQDESVTPFLEAQVEIRNKIVRQRKQKQIDEYIAKLHERTPVWTKFDALIAQQQKASSFLER